MGRCCLEGARVLAEDFPVSSPELEFAIACLETWLERKPLKARARFLHRLLARFEAYAGAPVSIRGCKLQTNRALAHQMLLRRLTELMTL